jgi:subtilisin family serine protease
LDDDGNGKADDVHGWHFYHLYSSGTYEAAEDAAIADDHGHGSHVAGIAAAATNNGIGVAGVSWGAKIMAVKMLDRYGDGWYSDAAAAVIYAADNGARVINLSLGGEEVSATLCAAIEYAHSRGCLVVAAAGNSGGSVLYPAACAQALAVAATTGADERATYSNHGPEVDLSAPGSSIYSTWPWLDGYFTLSGTSMAAAHVSGVAALVWSRWPVLGPDGVMQQLTRTAVDIDATGSDPYTGWGRIDAATATGSLRVEQLVFIPLCVGNLTNP